MPSAKTHDEVDSQAELALMESLWKTIREHLKKERQRVNEEIKNYPTPIPACDAQFNYLLEERTRVAEELDRLEAQSRDSLTRSDDIRFIGEFIASSNYINGEMEERIRSSLLSVLDGGI